MVEPPADAPPAFDPGRMHCPACGHAQTVSETCEACGVCFEEFNRQRRRRVVSGPATPLPVRDPPPTPEPPSAAKPTSAPEATRTAEATRRPSNWRAGWDAFEDAPAPDEDVCLTLFVGPEAPRYLKAFERLRVDGRTRFVPGWNWGAVLSPFLWFLYRRLWAWGAVLALVDVVAPLGFIVLGGQLPGAGYLVETGYGLLVLNRILWPAVADYLYLRQAKAALVRLERMSATRMHETEIVLAGGVSGTAVLAGLAFVLVFGMFLWNLADSVRLDGVGRGREARPAASTQPPAASRAPAASGMSAGAARAPNRWTATRGVMRGLGDRVDAWLASDAGAEGPGALTVRRLHDEVGIRPADLRDAWGAVIHFIPAADGYRLVSAGPDGLFGTVDDIQYRQTLKP